MKEEVVSLWTPVQPLQGAQCSWVLSSVSDTFFATTHSASELRVVQYASPMLALQMPNKEEERK